MIVVVAILAALLVVSEVRGLVDRRSAKTTERDLLDRIMSRTYGEFAAFDTAKVVTVPAPRQRSILTDDTGLIEVDDDDDVDE